MGEGDGATTMIEGEGVEEEDDKEVDIMDNADMVPFV